MHLEFFVRQRNAGAHPLTVMADPPREVAPGEVIDFDTPLAGFEPAEDNDNDTADEAEQAPDPAKTKSRKGKAAASADDGGEVTQ